MKILKVNATFLSIILALCCVVIWSFIPVFSRIGQSELNQFQYLFFSNVFSVIAVSTLFFSQDALRGFKIMVKSPKLLFYSFILGILDGLYYVLLYFGYMNENAYIITVAQYTWPLFIVLLALTFLKEKSTWNILIALFLGFFSLVITITKGSLFSLSITHYSAVNLTLIGSFAFALLSVLSKLFRLPAIAGTFFLFLFSTVFSLILVLSLSEITWQFNWKTIAVIVLNGAFINGLSYVLWLKALSLGNATKVAILVFLTPLLSATWVYLIFDESLHYSYLIGIILSIVSGLLITYSKKIQNNRIKI